MYEAKGYLATRVDEVKEPNLPVVVEGEDVAVFVLLSGPFGPFALALARAALGQLAETLATWDRALAGGK